MTLDFSLFQNVIYPLRGTKAKEKYHARVPFVIPAQAGIQEGERKNFWIPACAGMTWVDRR